MEIPRLEEFCGYCFKNNTRERELTTKRLEIIKYQRRLSNRLATLMFRGTPCMLTFPLIKLYGWNIFLFLNYLIFKQTLTQNDAKSCKLQGET